jgi:serpin B
MRLTDASAGFGLGLLDHMLVQPDSGNVFISPLSATIALSMAASAAQGETRAAMLKAMGLDPAVDPSGEARQTIERLGQSDANAQLELAQALWAQQGLQLSPAYVTKLRDDFKAQLANLDFSSPDAPRVVNAWVDAATHHKIDHLVDSFDPATVAYLVNATFFHALWATEFKPMSDSGDFTTFSGKTTKVSMMQRDESVTELRTPGYAAELLPYKGGRFSAVLILPNGVLTPAGFSSLLTLDYWKQTLQYFHNAVGSSLGGQCKPWAGPTDARVDCNGSLQMPKFKLDYGADLTGVLHSMGMPIPGAGVPAICGGCFVTDVVQKTYLEVDEKGTTAAAATGVAVATSLRIPTIVNRPFVLALIDNATDAPLFLGVIGNL